jgi:hypothetical protein
MRETVYAIGADAIIIPLILSPSKDAQRLCRLLVIRAHSR